MRIACTALALVTTLAAPPALATLALAQKGGCMACHGVDKKLVGPAFQEVARKRAADPDAVAHLAASIRKGGSGRWGNTPMPAQAQLSDADAKALAAWIAAGAQ